MTWEAVLGIVCRVPSAESALALQVIVKRKRGTKLCTTTVRRHKGVLRETFRSRPKLKGDKLEIRREV